jgi:hypothetical protein
MASNSFPLGLSRLAAPDEAAHELDRTPNQIIPAQPLKENLMTPVTSTCSSLPTHGHIACSLCHRQPVVFDETRTERDHWRITANPLSWGNHRPEVLILGFSKGPSQAGELRRLPHNEIPYRKGRMQVGKILAHVGLLPPGKPEELKQKVEQAIADPNGRFGWGSLIRCTVERFDSKKGWVGSGGMIDQFMTSSFGQQISKTCSTRFLGELPPETKLIIMFGLGAKNAYVATARKAIQAARPGPWRTINEVAYTDGNVVVVHVEHFASQGANIPNWLGVNNHPRARLGLLAREAVAFAMRGAHQM